jgi:hypothetical protein
MATISPAEAAASNFRFPNTLQGSGSGSGKSIKVLAQRSIKKRGDAHSLSFAITDPPELHFEFVIDLLHAAPAFKERDRYVKQANACQDADAIKQDHHDGTSAPATLRALTSPTRGWADNDLAGIRRQCFYFALPLAHPRRLIFLERLGLPASLH